MKFLINKLSWKGEYFYYLISFLILLLGVIPYFLAIIYALPVADDFSYSNDVASAGGHNLYGVFNMTKAFYKNWGGMYFAIILGGGIDPLRRWNFLGINLVLLCIFLLSIFIIGRFIYQLSLPFYPCKKSIIFFLVTVILFTCFNLRIAREMYFWFVGACGYTIPLFTGLLGFCCLVSACKSDCLGRKRKLYLIVCSVLGFLSSGGGLQITAYICWIYLLFLAGSIVKKRNIICVLFSFSVTLLGAFLNVAAPGNYIRKNTSYEEISIIKAIFYTIVSVLNEIKHLFSSSYLPWLLLVIMLAAFVYLKPVKEILYHPVLVGGVVCVSWLISTFPICYGYADSTLAERGYEILDIYIVLGMFLFINSLINWLKLKGICLSKETVLTVGILAVINIGYLQNLIPFSGIPGVQCWQQLFSGELKDYHNEWIAVLEAIEKSEDNIVEVPISRQVYDADVVIMGPGMTDNFEKWVNDGIAVFYDKEMVRVVIQDDINED